MALADVYTSAYGTRYGTGMFADVYPATYLGTYGVPYPQAPLDLRADLNLGGAWTPITGYTQQRDPSAPVTLTRGRADETTQATAGTAAANLNNRDGRFSSRLPTGPWYGLIGRNTPLRWSVPALEPCLRMEDDSVSGASCPDAAQLEVTGPFDIRVDVRPSSYMPCVLASKWQGLTPSPTGGAGLFGASVVPAQSKPTQAQVDAATSSWGNLVLPGPHYPGVQCRRVYYAGIPNGGIDNQIQSCINLRMKALISFNPTVTGSRTSNNLPSLAQMQTDQTAMVTYLNAVAAAFAAAGMTPASQWMSVSMNHEPTNTGGGGYCTPAQFQNIYATAASGGQSNYQALTAICPVIVDHLGNGTGASKAAQYFPQGSCDGLAVDFYAYSWAHAGTTLDAWASLADAAGIPLGLWEMGNSAENSHVASHSDMVAWFAYLSGFFGTAPGGRLANGLSNLELVWFQNNSAAGQNLILSASDYRIPLLQNLYSVTSASGTTASAQRGWALLLNGDGTLSLYWTSDGTLATVNKATSAMPVPLGRAAVRAVTSVSGGKGTVTFWTAPGGSASALDATGATPWTMLGPPVTGFTGMNVFPSTAPLAAGYNSAVTSDYAQFGGLTGRVYELQLNSYQGQYQDSYNDLYGAQLGGLPVADPGFYAQQEGTTSFADGQGNTWTLNGTAEISARNYRFHGEMSAVPVTWDPTGTDVYAPIQAGGLLRRLSQGTQPPVSSAFKRAILALTGALVPVAYWPMEDGTNATEFGPALGPAPMTFGVPPSLAADSTFACSAALSTIDASVPTGTVAPYTGAGSIVIRFLMDANVGSSPPADKSVLARAYTTGSIADFTLRWRTGGQLQLSGYTTAGGGSFLFDTGSLNQFSVDGAHLWVSMELQPASGGKVQYTIATLAVGETTPISVSGTFTGTVGNATVVQLSTAGGTLNGVAIGHLTVQSAWQPMSGLASPLAAWAGETCASRFARLCGENGVAARIYGFPARDVAMGTQAPDTFVNLLQACEDTGRGQIFEPRQALALGYRTVRSMCAQAPAVVLDYAQAFLGDGQSGLNPTQDDQYTVNDVSVSNADGATYETTLSDGSAMSVSAPPAGVGDYGNSYSVNTAADADLRNIAGWILNTGTVNEERYPVVPLHLARGELANLVYQLAEATVGDYIEIINPPTFLPPGPIKQLVYGTSETIGGFQWGLQWNCVPESPYEVGIVGDPVHGRCDTDGSVLDTATGTGAVADGFGDVYGDLFGASVSVIAVDTTGPSGILWTTSAADFPFDITVGGEVMTVTAISGAASPQVFTVIRSVNGVVKTHAAGETVKLAHPAIVALA